MPTDARGKKLTEKVINPFFHSPYTNQAMNPAEPPKPFVKRDQAIIELTERIEALENIIKMTFGGHVLINGQWIKVPI